MYLTRHNPHFIRNLKVSVFNPTHWPRKCHLCVPERSGALVETKAFRRLGWNNSETYRAYQTNLNPKLNGPAMGSKPCLGTTYPALWHNGHKKEKS